MMRSRSAAVKKENTSRGHRVVASYRDYRAAQKAVDHLADVGFPVERTAIVAGGIRFVEQVTGRRTYASVAVQGLLTGALVGAIVGFILGLFSFVQPVVSAFVLAFWALIFGGIAGAIVGAIAHAATGGRRDFSSLGGFEADHFDVLADDEATDEARKHLRKANLLGLTTTGA